MCVEPPWGVAAPAAPLKAGLSWGDVGEKHLLRHPPGHPAEPQNPHVSLTGLWHCPEVTWGPAGRQRWRKLEEQMGGTEQLGDALGGTGGPGASPWPGDENPAPQLLEFREDLDDALSHVL